jgi:hypothetical protein
LGVGSCYGGECKLQMNDKRMPKNDILYSKWR